MVSTTTETRAAEMLSNVLIVPVELKQGDNHPGYNSGSLHIVPAGHGDHDSKRVGFKTKLNYAKMHKPL